MLPANVVAFSLAVMQHDDDLDTPRIAGISLHIVVEPDRFGRLPRGLVELTAFAHEIIFRRGLWVGPLKSRKFSNSLPQKRVFRR